MLFRNLKALRNEALILQRVKHKNIVKYFGSFAQNPDSFRQVPQYTHTVYTHVG